MSTTSPKDEDLEKKWWDREGPVVKREASVGVATLIAGSLGGLIAAAAFPSPTALATVAPLAQRLWPFLSYVLAIASLLALTTGLVMLSAALWRFSKLKFPRVAGVFVALAVLGVSAYVTLLK
jgi:hypothetical protein